MKAIVRFAAGLLALVGASSSAQQASQLAPPLKPTHVAAGSPAAPPVSPEARPVLTRADVDAWLDGYLPYALRTGDIAGAVVVVVKDGQVVTQRGFGYADIASKRPVDPETTMFRPGSVSKLITWTAVMQQVEQHHIDLDADVNRYLDFRIPAYRGKPITTRQLLTHTPGFEDRAKGLIFFDPKQLHSLGDYLKLWIPHRIFAPGTTPAYSNYGAALAGYIVQRVSHQPFDDYVEQHIFAPLQMKHSTFRQPLPPALKPFMATGYPQASLPAQGFEIIDPAPAGSMSTSGADMGRFMLAHLGDGALGDARILSAQTAQEMHNTPTTIIPSLNRMELGFFETNVNGREVIAHLGDLQNFHTALHLFLADHVGLYLSVNSAGKAGAAHTLRVALLRDFADRYFPSTEHDGQVDAKTAADHARMMTGLWQGSRRIESGFVRALQLVGQTKVSVDDKGRLVIPDLKNAAGAPIRWTEIAPFLWREVGGHERLGAKVENGRVTRWSIDGESPFMVFEPVPAARSTGWIMPLLYASLAVLLLTFLHWPVAALTRRSYKAPFAVPAASRHAYRGVRLFAGLAVLTLILWMVQATKMFADLTKLGPASDGALWFLYTLGLVAFVGAVGFAVWNLLATWRDGRRWTGKLWAVLVLLSALLVLYVAFMFGLLSFTVNY